ncbi:carbohydrate-binding protein [Desulfothermobacter acidiphilus]|uniref:carbohydrate-binding protein n=1 Tax=Desulfothermobacter acidiphilus TaxID=1938353 RepID=UPI003F8B4824
MLKEAKRETQHPSELQGMVIIDPTPVTAGEEVTICYNGLLARSGAQQIYLHLGFGAPDKWHRVQDFRMSRTSWGWIKTVSIPYDEETLNFCFWDGAGNWDNNYGLNWSYIIHAGRLI